MIIKTNAARENPSVEYDVHVTIGTHSDVELGVQLSNYYHAKLTAGEAKRVAYALLLAAEGLDPKS